MRIFFIIDKIISAVCCSISIFVILTNSNCHTKRIINMKIVFDLYSYWSKMTISNLVNWLDPSKNPIIKFQKKLQEYFQNNLILHAFVFNILILIFGSFEEHIWFDRARNGTLRNFRQGISDMDIFSFSDIKIKLLVLNF